MGKVTDPDAATASVEFDARTGAVLRAEPDLETGFMPLLFVAALVSGAVVSGPFMRTLPFGMVRRDRAACLRWLDLHNLLGIVTLVWVLMVGLTEAYRGRPPPTSLASAQTLAETVRAVEPDLEVGSIAFPGTLFAGRHHYAALMHGATPLTERLVKPVLIDAQTAARALPWYITALLVSQPFHFGDYGGLPLKILWAALDVVTILVLVSGLYLWGKRRIPLVKNRARTVAVDTPAGAAERRGPA